jgi:hypothetical protein
MQNSNQQAYYFFIHLFAKNIKVRFFFVVNICRKRSSYTNAEYVMISQIVS